ncbi:MAG TPA: glycosyltransferase family 39 protein [Tepidisphaeraceae bacterium]|jgi:hypothetical protein
MGLVRNQILIRLFVLLAGAAVLFLAGINWGLPSRSTDAFLFGGARAWEGKQILVLAGNVEASAGRAADVSSKPLDRRDRAVVVVVDDDRDRARIVRRYRLMSYQPDEFTTFKSLSEMRPGRRDLDPRMYKYGGLWVYPVGALLKAASAARLVRVTPDAAYYLDHPEAFGRFYVVARLYSALWGLIGVAAVFLLVRYISADTAAATCAALCFMLMPVVVTAAHEAKPHLAGTTLMLLAVFAAARWVENGRRRWAIGAAILCGAAVGVVPSAMVALLLLPAMQVLRTRLGDRPAPPLRTRDSGLSTSLRVAGLAIISVLVYCMTNPYVPINLVRNRAVLRSNFGNSSDFYHSSGLGLPHALLLVGLGASFVLAIVGGIGAVALAVRAARKGVTDAQESRRRAAGGLLAVVTLPVGLAFVVFAAGQPADYARFALPFDVLLAIEGVVAIATFVRRPAGQRVCFGLLVGTTAFTGLQYVGGFVRDARPQTSRTVAAARIAGMLPKDLAVLASREEPAPWSLPPVDLFRWRIVLPPRGFPADRAYSDAAITVGPADCPLGSGVSAVFLSTPISWADKPFPILTGREYLKPSR